MHLVKSTGATQLASKTPDGGAAGVLLSAMVTHL